MAGKKNKNDFCEMLERFNGIDFPSLRELERFTDIFCYYDSKQIDTYNKSFDFLEKVFYLDVYKLYQTEGPLNSYPVFLEIFDNIQNVLPLQLDWYYLKDLIIEELSEEEQSKAEEDFKYYKIHGEYPSEGEDY